ncbi:hypothetical protein AFM12_10105 [Jiulongibacter sediminis]|uniref:Thioredoxin domain-containing protein n=1 Tax=Jiulongibacter sediminis TaxID=1605367 RepID=A0A0P7C2M3_9BACT|nr:hypothetical protein AFM12_10105 [Jiulongibacter sediminis]TBX25428.1 hypothetical protein TK44_10110 [Jiulongibacter sediminis]
MLAGCKQSQQNEDLSKPEKNSIIRIALSSDLENRLYYKDDLGNAVMVKLKDSLNISESYFQLFDAQYKIPFLLFPGDSLYGIVDGEFVKFHSGDERRDKELAYSNLHFQRFDIDSYDKWSFQNAFLTEELYKREELIEQEEADQQEFLRGYIKKEDVGDEFKGLISKGMQYKALSKLLFINNSKTAPQRYLDSLNYQIIENLNCDECLAFDFYRNLLFMTLDFLQKRHANESAFQLVKKYYSGRSKEYVLKRLIINHINEKGPSEIQEEVDNYLALKEVPMVYKEEVREIINFSNDSVLDRMVIDSKGQNHSLKSILEGNYTYVDFWASWCLPCRKEMPASKQLASDFANEGVNFLYLSVDENPINWKKASLNEGLGDNRSFLLPKNSSIRERFNLKMIPRYVIFDRKGEVIEMDAPRPSDKRIREILNELSHNLK